MEQTPDPKLIDSMSMKYRHDFGLLSEHEKESIRTTMKQIWEEVVGLGFYKPNKAKSELGGVEWLEQELKRNGLVNDSDISMNIETAKRIEKEQKEAAKIFGHQEGYKRGYFARIR
jgi:hypothetical protein